jgi:putative transposase
VRRDEINEFKVRALAVEMHEDWLEATRYLNMNHLKEHRKEAQRALAA